MTAIDLPADPAAGASRALAQGARRAGRVGMHALRGLALIVVSALLLPYTLVPRYQWPAATPFSGGTLHNPYAGIGKRWQRANFHAHSHAWGGLTSGHGTPDEVHAAYAAAGYDVIGISNYHRIDRATADHRFLPVYEHGFSIRKTHQLLIGARGVTALDFPLWQSSDAKQYLLGRMRDTAALTVVVHPYLRTGYDEAELAQLGGYDLLEVRSHWNDASRWWDAALTSGNAVWAIGNDDSHDVSRPKELGVVWTMTNAVDAEPASVIGALRAGAMYVVAADPGAAPTAAVQRVTIVGDTVTTEFTEVMSRIEVIADSGAVRATLQDARAISYALTADDHYARVVATTGGATLYLNPVIRSDVALSPRGMPAIRPLASLLVRAAAALAWLGALWLLLRGPVARLLRRTPGRSDVTPSALRRAAALLLTGAACLLPSTVQAQMAATELPFRIGEYHEYDLKFGSVTVGTGSLSVSGPDTLRGREVLRLRYEIKGGIPFFRVHDVMESWFDPAAKLSLRFTQELREGPKRYSRLFDFYPSELIVLERGKPRAPTVAQPLDDASFIFYVRTLLLQVGETKSFSRYFRPNANPVTIEVLRKETITVPAGTFNTIVVKPIIRTSGIFSEGGKAELWFSDDSSHTLVQMKAKLSFGSLSLYLRPTRARR